MNKIVDRIQCEMDGWRRHNFGDPVGHEYVLGVIEELGELIEAMEVGKPDKVRDAIGDVMIYSLNHALNGRYGFYLVMQDADHRHQTERVGTQHQLERQLWKACGKLAHAQLKGEQNIRTEEDHFVNIQLQLGRIYWLMRQVTIRMGLPHPVELLQETWDRVVAKRDYRVNPNPTD